MVTEVLSPHGPFPSQAVYCEAISARDGIISVTIGIEQERNSPALGEFQFYRTNENRNRVGVVGVYRIVAMDFEAI
jgi:hypothetical protein